MIKSIKSISLKSATLKQKDFLNDKVKKVCQIVDRHSKEQPYVASKLKKYCNFNPNYNYKLFS